MSENTSGEPMTSVEYFRRFRRRLPPTGQWLNDEGGFTDAGSIRFRNTGAYTGDTDGVLTYDGTDLTFNDGSTTHVLENNAVRVEDAGSVVGTRGGINFIEGANITLTITDDSPNDEVDVTIAASSSAGGVATGSYTGDGSTSQAITGLGFQPKVLWITPRETVDSTSVTMVWTTDVIIDDNASGGAIDIQGGSATHSFDIDKIIALGADGFTVDDGGADERPNANGVVYNYWALG